MKTKTKVKPDNRPDSESLRFLAGKVLLAKTSEHDEKSRAETNKLLSQLTSELMSLTWSTMHNTCMDIPHEDKNDIYQLICIKLYDNIQRYDGGRNFYNWYITLCRRTCIDWGRKTSRFKEMVVPIAVLVQSDQMSGKWHEDGAINLYPGPAKAPGGNHDYKVLRQVFRQETMYFLRVNPHLRKVIRLKLLHVTHRSIAKTTGLTQSQVTRGVKKWRRFLRGKFVESGIIEV